MLVKNLYNIVQGKNLEGKDASYRTGYVRESEDTMKYNKNAMADNYDKLEQKQHEASQKKDRFVEQLCQCIEKASDCKMVEQKQYHIAQEIQRAKFLLGKYRQMTMLMEDFEEHEEELRQTAVYGETARQIDQEDLHSDKTKS